MITCHVGVLFIYHGVVVFSNFSSLLPHSDMMQYAHSLDLLNELSPERYWQGTEIWGGCVWGRGGTIPNTSITTRMARWGWWRVGGHY